MQARAFCPGACTCRATATKSAAHGFHTCDADCHRHHDAVVMYMTYMTYMTYMSMVVAAVVANMVTSMIMIMVMSQRRSAKSISYRLSSSARQRAMRSASQAMSLCTQEMTRNPRVGWKSARKSHV